MDNNYQVIKTLGYGTTYLVEYQGKKYDKKREIKLSLIAA